MVSWSILRTLRIILEQHSSGLPPRNLEYRDMHFRIQNSLIKCKFPDRINTWSDWYSSSFVTNLKISVDRCADIGITRSSVNTWLWENNCLVGPNSSKYPTERAREVRNKVLFYKYLQKGAHALLHLNSSSNFFAEHRLGTKLSRWNVSAPLGIAGRRVHQNLQRLAAIATPKVRAAVFRWLWNGLCIARRFQEKKRCKLCNQATALDCIEHYIYCHPVRVAMHKGLDLDSSVTKDCFFLAEEGMEDKKLLKMGAIIYAIHSSLKLLEMKIPEAEVVEVLLQRNIWV